MLYQITLFGGFRLEGDQQEIIHFRTRKGKLLLAYLATFPGEHSRAKLAHLLYPGRSKAQALLSLRVELVSLRRILDVDSLSHTPLLTIARDTLALNTQYAFIDVQQFEWLLAQAAQVDEQSRIALLEQACHLYRGDYLEGYNAEWIQAKRSVLCQQFVGALGQLCAIYLRQGEPVKARMLLQHSLDRVPKAKSKKLTEILNQINELELSKDTSHREGIQYAVRRLPSGLLTFAALRWGISRGVAQVGSRCQALGGMLIHRGENMMVAVFDSPMKAAQWVTAEMEMDEQIAGVLTMDIWSPERHSEILSAIQQLILSLNDGWIVCTEPVAQWLQRDPKWSLQEMRFYFYSNLSERLFLVNPKCAVDNPFRTNRSLLLRERHLPVPVGQLWGRECELEILHKWFESARKDRAPRLLTIVGVGGVGKTRLALEFAHQLTRITTDEVVFVPLETARTTSEVEYKMLSALNEEFPKLRVHPVHALRARPMLIILDRVEHLRPILGELLTEWLEQAPKLKVVTTSRTALGIQQEQVLSLAPLPVPAEDVTTPDELQAYASVRLFVNEAQRVRPDFRLSPRNALVIADICRYAGGIPLALMLYAKRLNIYTPNQLLDNLKEFSITDNPLNLAIGWSFYYLPEHQQHLLCKLGIFNGAWTLESASAVLQEPLLNEYLDRFLSTGLVVADYREDSYWFFLPTPIREFVRRFLDHKTRELFEQRYAQYYIQLIQQLLSDSTYLNEEHLRQLCLYQDHLLASIEWAIRTGELELAAGLITALVPFFETIGLFETPLRWGEQILKGTLSSVTHARLLNALARLQHRLGNWQLAEQMYSQAHTIAVSTSQPTADAEALIGLAGVNLDKLCVCEAEKIIIDTLNMYEGYISMHLKANALLRLGYAVFAQLRIAEAQQYMEQAVELHRQIGEKRYLALALNALGWLKLQQGEISEAETLLKESLTILEEIHDRALLPYALLRFGDLQREYGKDEEAIRIYQNALEMSRGLHAVGSQRAALTRLGEIYYSRRKYRLARKAFMEACALFPPQDIAHEAPPLARAWCALLNGTLEEAKEILVQQLEMIINNHNFSNLQNTLELITLVFKKEKQFLLCLEALNLELQLRRLCRKYNNIYFDKKEMMIRRKMIGISRQVRHSDVRPNEIDSRIMLMIKNIINKLKHDYGVQNE